MCGVFQDLAAFVVALGSMFRVFHTLHELEKQDKILVVK